MLFCVKLLITADLIAAHNCPLLWFVQKRRDDGVIESDTDSDGGAPRKRSKRKVESDEYDSEGNVINAR